MSKQLLQRLRSLIQEKMPLPGAGETAYRHRRLMEIGRADLSLARLAEAHWDAVAILCEAGRAAEPNSLYGVWASEKPGQVLSLDRHGDRYLVRGTKMFCSGTGLVDRALITVNSPEQQLVDVDLRSNADVIHFDESDWKTDAFRETKTATAVFSGAFIGEHNLIGSSQWYVQRAGFWHGACGPAACWAGGAAGLLDYATRQSRSDPHSLAHLGAMHASVWALESNLDSAGRQIDATLHNRELALIRALSLRHLVEQACTDVLRRLTRAYGPHPLAMDEDINRRCQELDLYLRQSHAERDLESLGNAIRNRQSSQL
jgi:alkylation response protein AidB-like acyl-CoA dehydrogenase